MIGIKNSDLNKAGYITDLHHIYGPEGDFILTKYGSLLGAIELSGRDPDPLLPDDFAALSAITRNIYRKLNKNIVVIQYFAHFDNAKVSLKPRKDPISNKLSQGLASFLNKKNLKNDNLVHYFEVFPTESLNKLNLAGMLKHALSALFDKNSRLILQKYFTEKGALIIQTDELERQKNELSHCLKDVESKWSGLMEAKILSLQEIWAHMRFLSTCNSDLLVDGLTEVYPTEAWDKKLHNGDIKQVSNHNAEMIKFDNPVPIYSRIASVTSFADKEVMPGAWFVNEFAPLRQKYNCIAMIRWKPLSTVQKAILFKKKETEVERASLSMVDVLTGNKKTIAEKHMTLKPAIKKKMEELGAAEAVDDIWGVAQASFILFNKDPAQIIEDTVTANKAFSSVGLNVVWESSYAPIAYQAFQPGGWEKSLRDMDFTASQLGASSLFNRISIGQTSIPYAEKEEAQYIFQTTDGSPFYYSPYVAGKSLVIAVGATRSGKSFVKNTIAGHFLKYGGLIRSLDIDPGTEMLANVFKDKASVFKISDNEVKGLNPFVSAKGENDLAFMRHLITLLMAMIEANDQPELKHLATDEQSILDLAIKDTLELPKAKQRLGTLIGHISREELRQKFARWVNFEDNKGMYADLLDAAVDSIGEIDKPLAVFNLQGLKENKTVLGIMMMEIFYRVTSIFENPEYRTVPKFLEIDEAHELLKYKSFVEYLNQKIRTWNKYLGGISLWSQSPEEFIKSGHWSLLKSSVSTFLFTANLLLNDEEYKSAFGLTDGELEQIRTLVPRKEIYIIQPEIGISKKLLLDVDKSQYVVSTSNPIETTIRNRYIEELGFDKGVEATIKALDERKVQEETDWDKRLTEMGTIKKAYYGK